jgi:hypothetical protein
MFLASIGEKKKSEQDMSGIVIFLVVLVIGMLVVLALQALSGDGTEGSRDRRES